MWQLEFQSVRKRYAAAGPWVVDGLDLTIARGELVTLLGPSGCGKTTTLRLIAGLEWPSDGRILMAGQDVTRHGAAERSVGMMFQSYALFPHLTVLDNVAYGLTVQSAPRAKERALEMLRVVGLQGFEGRWPAELSGGQQQRVALARSLVMEPEILLFDEPLSNLDAKLRRDMRLEIRRLQQSLGLTVVYVTHDQAEAMAVSDRICVMNHGRIAQQGSPLQLYQQPVDPFVAAFMGETLLVHARALGAGQGMQLGEWVWPEAPEHPAGQVQLAIRPEAWRLVPAGQGLAATVIHCAFMGAVQELTLDTALGQVVTQCPSSNRPLAQGERLGLALDAHGVVVFAQATR
ncbi:MAG: hypothetical protein RIT26_659 [Pseudomonadota bacterium]|jgi:iron(III) transport system ATP-binding protein